MMMSLFQTINLLLKNILRSPEKSCPAVNLNAMFPTHSSLFIELAFGG